MGDIVERLSLIYGDNCTSLFDKHGFVWEWQTINGTSYKDGCIVTGDGKLKGYDNIREIAALYGSIHQPSDEIVGYAILRAKFLDKAYKVELDALLIERLEVLKPDDTIEEVDARIQRYTGALPEVIIRVDRLYYRLKLDSSNNPYFKLETSRTPRRNLRNA